MAMPRGSGKTTICECACIWAVLYGHREFVYLIGWTAREIVLLTISRSKASGAIIKVAGITGRIRGMKHKRADGQTVRLTLVLLDGRGTRVERAGFAWERGKVIAV
jgi:hypothetical protein